MKSTLGILIVPLTLGSCFSETSCFLAGTLIATPAGPIPIEALVVGDVVWSFSLERGEKIARRVRAVLRATANEVRVIAARGNVILGVTTEHPFYDLARREYRPARDLVAGDVLAALTENGISDCVIDQVSAKELAAPSMAVFNLTIDGPEANYFAAGMLVHNKTLPIEDCQPQGVEIAAYRPEVGDAEPGVFDVTWTVLPTERSIDIYRPGPAGIAQPSIVDRVSAAVDRIRFANTPEPGDYEVRVSGSRETAGELPCGVRHSLAFSIAALPPNPRR
jgi:hypothetical protein